MMHHADRNIIVVAGPFGSGKTHFLNELRDAVAPVLDIPFEYIPISDAHTITERLRQDDRAGGLNHYHPATRDAALTGDFYHEHNEAFPIYPFTVAGNEIIVKMTQDFLRRLSEVPRDNRLYFAEWSMGENTNAPSEPASRATALSCESIARFLQNGTYPSEGLNRVFAVLHPQTTLEQRLDNNENRGLPSEEDYRLGRRSWKIAPEGMRITGKDDFEALKPALRVLGVPHVVEIFNGHRIEDERYPEMQAEIVRQLTAVIDFWRRDVWQGGETGRGHTPERER